MWCGEDVEWRRRRIIQAMEHPMNSWVSWVNRDFKICNSWYRPDLTVIRALKRILHARHWRLVKGSPEDSIYTLSRISTIKGGRVGQKMFCPTLPITKNFMVTKTHVVHENRPVTTNGNGSILWSIRFIAKSTPTIGKVILPNSTWGYVSESLGEVYCLAFHLTPWPW